MAMNVSFKKGLKAALPSTRDANTFYYVSDEFALYLGNHLISNEVTLEQFNALASRVKTLEDWKTALTELSKDNGTNDLVKVTVVTEAGAVKTVTVDDAALDKKLEDDLTEAKNYTDTEIGTLKIGDVTYDTVVDYVIAKTTGIATDSVVQGKADKIAPTKAGNIAVLTADGNLSDGGKTVAEVEQVAKNYTDDEITGLEFDLSDDGKELSLKNKAGVTVATLDTTEFVVDGFLTRVAVDKTENTLTFYWNTDSGEQSTEIELSSIADIYTGKTSNDGISINVSNTNEISAIISTTLEDRITDGETAYSWGNHAEASYLKAGDISGKEDKSNLKALAYKDTIDTTNLIADKVVTKTKLEENVQDSLGKADTAVQKVETGTINGTIKVDNTNVAIYGLGSAAYTNSDAYDAKDTAKNLIGFQQSGNTAATGVYAVIQGATTNTVKDCVDAINALNAGTAQTNKDINAISTSVNDVVTQLTWGSF